MKHLCRKHHRIPSPRGGGEFSLEKAKGGTPVNTAAFNQTAETQGVYRHYKGKMYRVLGMARHSETLEDMVVYQALYEDQKIWVRPAVMFFGTLDLNGTPQARFMKIEEIPA